METTALDFLLPPTAYVRMLKDYRGNETLANGNRPHCSAHVDMVYVMQEAAPAPPMAASPDEGVSWEDKTGMHTWPRKEKAPPPSETGDQQ